MLRNIMRTSILASLLGLSLVACAGQIEGGQGPIPENCGNGAIDTEDGETCDDGNNIDGDGCSAVCTSEVPPSLNVTVDKPTVATELGTSNMITATLQGVDGFAGPVGLSVEVLDSLGAPLPDWVAAIQPTSLDLPVNGTGSAVVTLAVPSQNKGLVGSVRIITTSSATLGTREATSAVTALNQISFNVTDNAGQCVYPTAAAIMVTEGTKVRFVNGSTIGLIIHSDGDGKGVAHQSTAADMPPGQAYEQTVANADGADFGWYCHSPGPNLGGGNPKILVVAP
jgi:cysteine-rich repeat protein